MFFSWGLRFGVSHRALAATLPAWSKVAFGGLGFVTGLEINSRWMAAKTDVGGLYRRAVGETKWTQIVTSPGFPASLRNVENYVTNNGNTYGCWEIAQAKSNLAVCYAVFKAAVVKSVDDGITWTQTNFSTTGSLPANQQGGLERLVGAKMVVDPGDENHVILFSPTAGAYRTVDGGATWTQPTGLPNISGLTAGTRICMFACDESTPVGPTRVWFAAVNGAGNGIFRSTDNGATWAAAGAGSATVTSFGDIVYRGAGVIWVTDFSSGLTSDNIAVWTQGTGYSYIPSTPGGFLARYISVHPTNPNEITAFAGGASDQFIRSTNGGTTWTAEWTATTIRSQFVETRAMSYAQDQDGAGSYFWSAAKPQYHPTDGYLYWPNGYGVTRNLVSASAFTAPNAGDKVVMLDHAAGMEELVSVFALLRTGGPDIFLQQDKTVMALTDTKSYALPAFPRGVQLGNAYFADRVHGDPDKLAFAVGGNLDGFSNDGGLTGTTYVNQPNTGRGGGSILRLDANRSYRQAGQNTRPRYTSDNGATPWLIPTFVGATLPADGTTNGFGTGLIDFTHRMVTKVLETPSTLFCANFGEGGANLLQGIWKSVDWGATWNKQTSSLVLTPGTQNGHATLLHVDGVLYYIAGSVGSAYTQQTTTAYLFRSLDEGVTWTAVRTVNGFVQNIGEPQFICWGAPVEGSAFRTIYLWGWVDNVLGVFYSKDRGVTWTALPQQPVGFDDVRYIAADPDTPFRIALGRSGTGHDIYQV
jgi:xyloglucan-specific exo-beta-1,4-glucanase